MASNQTEHIGLNQWELTDDVRMEDFNADNAKIDAALAGAPHVAVGHYAGDGTFGKESPTVLTVDFPAKFVMIWADDIGNLLVATRGGIGKMFVGNSSSIVTTAWEGNSLYITHTTNVQAQMNQSGTDYYYFAIG